MVADMRGIVSALALAMAVLSSPATAQFADGNELRAICKENPDLALTYAIGVLDAAYMYQQLMGVKDRICLPETLHPEQVRDVACNYLEENPADRHHLGADLVAESAATAWPCK